MRTLQEWHNKKDWPPLTQEPRFLAEKNILDIRPNASEVYDIFSPNHCWGFFVENIITLWWWSDIGREGLFKVPIPFDRDRSRSGLLRSRHYLKKARDEAIGAVFLIHSQKAYSGDTQINPYIFFDDEADAVAFQLSIM